MLLRRQRGHLDDEPVFDSTIGTLTTEPAATTTTAAPATTSTSTTITRAMSRDAELAVRKCVDAIEFGVGLGLLVAHDVDGAEAARDLCDDTTVELETREASVQLVTRDATAPHDSVISVHVGASVDEAYAEAKRRGYEIVHPLMEEAWGVRRFFVRSPDGKVINMVSHTDE